MANNRENYYIKLILEAVDKSSPAFNALERQINKLSNDFKELTGITDHQTSAQERLTDSLERTTKARRAAVKQATDEINTTREQILVEKELAQARVELRKAEQDLARTRADSTSTVDELLAAEVRADEKRDSLAEKARQRRIDEISQNLNANEKLSKAQKEVISIEDELAKTKIRKRTETAQFIERQNSEELKALESELHLLERRRELIRDALNPRKKNVTLSDTLDANGQPYKTERGASQGLTRINSLIPQKRKEIAEFKREKIEIDGVTTSIDDLGMSISKTTTRISVLVEKLEAAKEKLKAVKKENQRIALQKFVTEGGDPTIAQAAQLIQLEERAAATGAAIDQEREKRRKASEDADNAELQRLDDLATARERAAQRGADIEDRANRQQERARKARRETLLQEIASLRERAKVAAETSDAEAASIRKVLAERVKEFKSIGGRSRDIFAFKTTKEDVQLEQESLDVLFERAKTVQKLNKDLDTAKTKSRDARISGDSSTEQFYNAQILDLAAKIEAEKLLIEKALPNATIGIDFNVDEVSAAKVEALKAIISKKVEVEVEFDTDQKSLGTFAALAGGVNAFKEGIDNAGRGIAAFDNIIRGLLVLGIALFFEQIIIAALGAAAALSALAASAIAAGSALAGALAAGALQAAPAIGVLAAFANRVGNVFRAVKQANLLQQQESYKGGQAASKQASSLDAVVSASERVKDAQEKVTEARKKAREALEDLILSERKQTISAKEADLALRANIASGEGGILGAQESQINAEEARLRLSRTRSELRTRTRGGIEGSPEVKDALKNLVEAQRALAQAKQSATQAGGAVDATTGKLDYLLSNLSKSERRLYRGLVELQNRWRKFAQQVSEPLTNSFVFAIDRINSILKSRRLINVGKSLGEALGQSFRRVFDFLLSRETIGRILAFADSFKRNLIPLTNIAINLSRIFLDIAEVANPVLATIIDYFDRITSKFAQFTGSVSGKNELADFFDAGSKSLIKFFDLIGAVTRVIFALIGKPGSGMGLDAGNVVLDQLIGGLNKLADDIQKPSTRVSQFFRRFFNFAKEVLPLFKPLIVAIGEALDRIFSEDGISSLRGFVEFASKFVIPAIADFAIGVAKVTKIVVDLTDQFPLLGKAIQAFIAIALAGSVLGRVNSLLAPFQSLAAYAFVGKGKQSIFKILAADADGAFPSIKKVLDAWNASDALFKPSRFGIGGKGAPGAASGLAREALPGAAGAAEIAGETAGVAGAGSAAIGALTNPVTLVVAGVAALTATFIALLAIAGKLDDVMKALGNAFKFVKEEVSNAFDRIKKAITDDKDTNEALKSWIKILKSVGTVLADFQIKQLKGTALLIAAIIRNSTSAIVYAIKLFGSLVNFVSNLYKSVKTIAQGIRLIFLGILDVFTGNGSDRLKQGARTLGRGIFLAFMSPMKLLRLTIFRMFNGMFGGLLKQVEVAVNLVRGAVKNIASVYNALPASLITGKIDTSGLENRVDITPEKQTAKSSGGKNAPQEENDSKYQRRVARRRTQQGQSQAELNRTASRREKRAANAANLEDAEKFLNAFNPETVKLSSKIKEKIADYWVSLRRQARISTQYVVDKLRDIRSSGGKIIDLFVTAAQSDVGKLRRSFRSNFLGMANIVRNQMVNVSNIVANQMQNAAMSVYKGAKYIKETLNDALKAVGGDEVDLTIKIPRVREERKAEGGFVRRADGGWIGNRGERGRDMVPTMLGRGEAVLNWGQQRVVEPALRQTYGFGLDDMFNRTRGYHAGGPKPGGLARGGRRDGVYTASVYNDAQGYKNDILSRQPYNWAELGVNGGVGNAFGGLPYKSMIKVSYKGRSVNLKKLDIGSGGPGIGGKIRAVDIWQTAANRLRLPGLANVFVSFSGATGSAGNAAQQIEMPKIEGGSKPMRDLVGKSIDKIRKAANKKIERETPVDVTGPTSGASSTTGLIPQVRRAIAWARSHGWAGQVISGFRTRAEQAILYARYLAGGNIAARPGTSNHERGRAIDVTDTPGFLKAMQSAPANARLIWYGPGDSVHFSVDGRARGGFVGMANGGRAMASKRSPMFGGDVGYSGTPSKALQKQWEKYNFDRYAGWLRQHRHSKKLLNGRETFFDASGNEYFPAISGARTFNTSHLSPRDYRDGNWEWYNRGGQIQKFASGGTVNGRDGQAIPIMAHAGEWVLNKRQQNMIAGIAGTTADRLKGMLGFSGGPTGFAGGGKVSKKRIKRMERFLDYDIPTILPLDVNGISEIINNVNKRIDRLNKTSIKKYKRDFKKFIDRINDLTDPERGLLTILGENIQKSFEGLNRTTLLKSVGLAVTGKLFTSKESERSRLTKINPEADPAKLAEERAKAQEALSKDLQGLRDRYVNALLQIQRKLKTVRRDVGVGDSGKGGFDKRIDSVEKEIKRLEKGDESEAQKKRIKQLKETLEKLKKNKKTEEALVTGRRNIANQINEIEDKIIEAENQLLEERKTAFEETTNNLLKASNRSSAISELKKTLAEYGVAFNELNGTTSNNTNPTATVVESLVNAAQQARDRVEILRKRLAEATANAANDPRWQSVVDSLQEEFGAATLAAVQAQADIVSGAISETDRIFQRGETTRGIREQAAALAERTLGTLNGSYGSQVTDARRGILSDRAVGVRDQIRALEALRSQNLNPQQLEDLNNKIAELTKTAESLDQDIVDLNQTYRRQLVEAIQARTQRTTGIFGNAQSIFDSIARASGTEDNASRVRVAQATGAALQGERTDLISQVLGAINSTDEFSQQSRDLLQTLLASFQSGDPGSFANLLLTLGPAISALESTLGETERGALASLIDSLVNNTSAVVDNTANLRDLLGLANQPQPFSTTSWTKFREAIFNGIGDVLPQFQVPQMATGGYITRGGMFELHPGEFVVNPQGSNIDQGDINITVNEANKPLDVTALASRIAFEKRTRK